MQIDTFTMHIGLILTIKTIKRWSELEHHEIIQDNQESPILNVYNP